jgi:hypothetical protein
VLRPRHDHGAAADIFEQVDLPDDQAGVSHQSERIGRGPDRRVDFLGRDFGAPESGVGRRELGKGSLAAQCRDRRCHRGEQNDPG